jgi:hypothetical protein
MVSQGQGYAEGTDGVQLDFDENVFDVGDGFAFGFYG